jgi:hypothetical protein
MGKRELTMTVAGDLMLGGEFSRWYRSLCKTWVPAKIAQVFESDVVFANLECACSRRGRPIEGKNLHYCAPISFGALDRLNINVVNLANNHILDYGIEGVRDTMAELDRRGIRYGGVGQGLAEARRPVLIETARGSVAWLFFSWTNEWIDSVPAASESSTGVNPWQVDLAVQQVAAARREFAPDWLCVSVHWERVSAIIRVPTPSSEQGSWSKWGADLVVGHHTHCLQAGEMYRGKPIFYSLGNLMVSPFFRDSNRRLTYEPGVGTLRRMSLRERRTLVARLRLFDQGRVEVRMTPVLQNEFDPILTEPDESTRHAILDSWQRRSERVQRPDYALWYGGYRRWDELLKYVEELTDGGWRKVNWRTPWRFTHKLVTGQNRH